MSIGRGILAIWHDVEPDRLDATLTWYDREHHLERLGVPGFRSARRYHAVEADRFLFIRYETDSPEILTSAAYLARVNAPTEWTQRSQPHFLGNIRSVCTREKWEGWAEGGFALTARLTAGSDAPAAPPWDTIAPLLLGTDGIVGAELLRADRASSTVPTDEKRLRGREDGYVDWAVVVHATTLPAARRARDVMEGGDSAGAADLQLGIYQLAAASRIMS